MNRQISDFIKKQNKGAAMVLVIVAMAFVGIFAVTIMWMSLANYRMKITDRQVKESFYSAEVVFEQIMAGLQGTASLATDKSYAYIMQNYSNFDEAKRNSEFQKEYLKEMQRMVAKSETEFSTYDVEKLMSFVDANLNVGIVTPSSSSSWIGARSLDASKIGTDEEYKSRYGKILAPLNADYFILEGLHLEYIDEDGYLAIIDTDLMISAPTAAFTQSENFSDAFRFAIVADDCFANTETSGLITVNGNLYAGENGIQAFHAMTLQDAEYIVSKGEVSLKNANAKLIVGKGSATGDVPQLWADNISLEGGELQLNANAYIKDDMTLNGNGSKAVLAESFYGYSTSDTNPKESSAIIINGRNSTLDMSKTKNLLLSGHAFTTATLSKHNDIASQTDADGNPIEKKNPVVPIHDSIAIKGNQVAYLVPDECIGVLNGQSLFGKNPLTQKEYEIVRAYMAEAAGEEAVISFKEVDVHEYITGLNNNSLASYGINESGGIQKLFVPSNGETLVYYYLVFPSQTDATRYFEDYYRTNKKQIDHYFDVYATGGVLSNTAYTRVNIAGNYLTATTAEDLISKDVALNNITQSIIDEETLKNEALSYTQVAQGLTCKLTKNYLSLTQEEKERTVFHNIFNADEIEAYLSGHTETFTLTDGSGFKGILVDSDPTPGDGANAYHYNGSDPKVVLIVSTGDVEVTGNFEGIIFAGGKVTVSGGVTVTSAENAGKMSQLARVLQQPSASGTTCILDFVRGASGYVLEGTALKKDDVGSTKEAIDFSELVKYQNWVKQ